jgi:hypothetical protein
MAVHVNSLRLNGVARTAPPLAAEVSGDAPVGLSLVHSAPIARSTSSPRERLELELGPELAGFLLRALVDR